jgi:hypothetical protein
MAVTLGYPDYPSDTWGIYLPWSSPLIRLGKEYQGKRGGVNSSYLTGFGRCVLHMLTLFTYRLMEPLSLHHK